MKKFLPLALALLLGFAACNKNDDDALTTLAATQWQYDKNDTLWSDDNDYMVIYNTFILNFEDTTSGVLDVVVAYLMDGTYYPAQTEHSPFTYSFDGHQGDIACALLQGTWQLALPAPDTLRLSRQTVIMNFTKK